MTQFKSHFNHADLQSKRKVKDEADVQSLVDMLENNWIDPCNSENQDLICLSTGKGATPEVTNDLLNARRKGEQAYNEFSQKMIESTPPKQMFYDTISKLEVENFQRSRKEEANLQRNWKEDHLESR